MKELAGLFGWFTAIGFLLAVLNFFVKYINKKFIMKLSKEKTDIIKWYRKLMRFIVKNHRWFGIGATAFVLVHLIMQIFNGRISFTGLISSAIMIIVFLLGIYGYYIKKDNKASWLKIHRILALILIITILLHV